MDKKSTILLSLEVRNELAKLGKKRQTYNDIIKELIKSKNRLDLLENKPRNLHSSYPTNT